MLMASLRVAGFEHPKQVICPEPLKESAYLLGSSFQGYWSRRITDEHRLRIMMRYHGF
jgi:Txe/YoeB family toxin of Txe-Axe toxin-antitoxin module